MFIYTDGLLSLMACNYRSLLKLCNSYNYKSKQFSAKNPFPLRETRKWSKVIGIYAKQKETDKADSSSCLQDQIKGTNQGFPWALTELAQCEITVFLICVRWTGSFWEWAKFGLFISVNRINYYDSSSALGLTEISKDAGSIRTHLQQFCRLVSAHEY